MYVFSPINENQTVLPVKFDEKFADDHLTAKTVKFTSLDNFYIYIAMHGIIISTWLYFK